MFHIPPGNFKKALLSLFCKAPKDILSLVDALFVQQKDLWERKRVSINKHNYSFILNKI